MELIETVATSRWYYRLSCFILFYLAAAASFNGSIDKWHLDDIQFGSTHGTGSLESAIDGTGGRPFVYRQLLPTLANQIDRRIPEAAKDRLFNLKRRNGLLFRERFIDSPIAQDRTYFLRYWIVFVAVFLFSWISVYAMYLVGQAMGFLPSAAAIAAIAMILLMPYIQDGAGHYYDYPELAFLMLAIWMAIKFDWWWMIPLVALATYNKESFLLFTPTLYPFLRQRTSRIHALAGIGVLGLTAAAVNFLLHLQFSHNPGASIEFHLMDQIRSLPALYDPRYMNLVKTYDLWMPRTENLLSLTFIAWTVLRIWRLLPKPIQRHMQIAAVISFPLYFMFCIPFEVRDLSFLYGSLLALIAANLTYWIHEAPRSEASARVLVSKIDVMAAAPNEMPPI